jgi:type IV pilus assembly protein PilA
MKERMRKSKGFTLIEMLIVVAIIAILIAVSVPLVSSALEKTRIATDAANERSALALGKLKYLTEYDSLEGAVKLGSNTAWYYYYDPDNDRLVSADGIHSGDSMWQTVSRGQCSEHKDLCLMVCILDDGTTLIRWGEKANGASEAEKWGFTSGVDMKKIQQ